MKVEAMEYNVESTVEQIRQLNLTGNIIPHSWYSKIKFPGGTTDLLGIILLSDIVYWYRPMEIKDERTGKLIGFRKKFAADMLQRSISSFAQQFGVSKRQVTEALKRLEDSGLIIKEFRTVETTMGVLYNVLFLAPVPTAIEALDENPKHNDFSDNEEISHDNSLDVPPITFERSGGYVQTYQAVRSNVSGSTFKRDTYTDNTTKNTTNITAAEKGNFHNALLSHDVQSKSAAAVFSKKIENNNTDALITDVITRNQIKTIQDSTCELTRFTMTDPEKLAKEIEFAILSTTAFTNAGRDFFKKLNTIKKVIKAGQWSTPAGMIEKKEIEHKKSIDPIKRELSDAALDCVHWQKMMCLSLEKGQESDANNFKKLLQQAQEKMQSIKLKFFDVC